MIRDHMLKRSEIVLIVMAGLAAAAAMSPKIYEQFTVRSETLQPWCASISTKQHSG